MTKRRVAAALTAACLCLSLALSFPFTCAAAAECAPPGGEKQIAIRLHTLFDALAVDDAKVWGQIVDPSFYAFDASKRLDGNALLDMLKSAHGAGVKIAWHLDEIDVHIDCTTAWFSLINHGAIGDSSGLQPMSWQESGVFNYVGDQWKLRFFHSNRVPPKN